MRVYGKTVADDCINQIEILLNKLYGSTGIIRKIGTASYRICFRDENLYPLWVDIGHIKSFIASIECFAIGSQALLRLLDIRCRLLNGVYLGNHRLHPIFIHIPSPQPRCDFEIAEWAINSLSNHRLAFRLQPVVSKNGRQILYREYSSRIVDFERRLIFYPSSFLPSLERTGEIANFDICVVQAAVRALHSNPLDTLGVNINASTLLDGKIWEKIIQELQSGIGNRLIIELKERADFDRSKYHASLRKLKELGVRFAIDHFGSRFGKDAAIALGNPDIIKIDAFFISSAVNDRAAAGTAHRIIGLAKTFGKIVVAEGVRTQAQYTFAEGLGVEWVQGDISADILEMAQ